MLLLYAAELLAATQLQSVLSVNQCLKVTIKFKDTILTRVNYCSSIDFSETTTIYTS